MLAAIDLFYDVSSNHRGLPCWVLEKKYYNMFDDQWQNHQLAVCELLG